LLAIGLLALRIESSECTPTGTSTSSQRFIQLQLFTCFILREVLYTTSRGVVDRAVWLDAASITGAELGADAGHWPSLPLLQKVGGGF